MDWLKNVSAPTVPAFHVHQGSLIPVTELSKPWNPNRRRKYHLWPPATCETVSWLESCPGDSLGMGTFLFQCLLRNKSLADECFLIPFQRDFTVLCADWPPDIWQITQGFGHRWMPLNRPVRTNIVLFLSKPLERNKGDSVTLHAYLGRDLGSRVHKSMFRWT